jgi:hypothetical protein
MSNVRRMGGPEDFLPGYRDVVNRGKELIDSDPKKRKEAWIKTGGEVLGAQTAIAMIGSAPAAIASGSLGPLFANTIAQPMITAASAVASATPFGLLGAGAVAGGAYLLNKRRRYYNSMIAAGYNRYDILEDDIKRVIASPARPLFEGINLGVGLINNFMIEGSTLDKTLDAVAARGKGTYQGEILEPVDKALSFVERITNFNPALAFVPEREKKKAESKGEEGKKAA